MPDWVTAAANEYSKRLREFCALSMVEIPLQKRGKAHSLKSVLYKEAELLLKQIPANSYVIALDRLGNHRTSEQLASRIDFLQQTKSHLTLIIGGPEGITEPVMQQVHEKWALSQLTLPHPIARIVLLETLYRSWTILADHPYHK